MSHFSDLMEGELGFPPDGYGYDDVGYGWFDIIARLVHDLDVMGWDRQLNQVKEKFGTLRFYIGAGSGEMHDRIAVAEGETARTCEDCGKPGVTRAGQWIRTLCDECDSNRPRP